MSLALIPTQPAPGRRRVAAAQALLQQALEELRAARADEAREAERRLKNAMQDAAARTLLRKREAAQAARMVTVDKRDWNGFVADLRRVATAARNGGLAQDIARSIEVMAARLEDQQ
jgi:hypothetical protein